MNGVDRMDSTNALSCIGLQKCKRRFHGQIFIWLLKSITFHDLKIIFEDLLGPYEVKKLRKKHAVFGYFHWVQLQLGAGLVQYGLNLAQSEVAQAAEAQDSNSENIDPNIPAHTPRSKRLRDGATVSHFLSCRSSPPTPLTVPPAHHQRVSDWTPTKADKSKRVLRYGYCKGCLEKKDEIQWLKLAGCDYQAPIMLATGCRLSKVSKKCSTCYVRLCEKYHKSWDHVNIR
jgi:hypothetical protein